MRRRFNLVVALTLAVGASACGESVRTEYDDLSDVTRVRLAVGKEAPVQLETLFVCAGRSLCRPDSVSVQLTSLGPALCPRAKRTWTSADSTFLDCSEDTAVLVVDSGRLSVAVLYSGQLVPGGIRGPDFIVEDVFFDLSLDDLRRIAHSERDVEFHLGEAWVSLPFGHQFWLDHLLSAIERDADPDATVWDGAISAHYQEEDDETRLQAMLYSKDADDGIALFSLEGSCPGRGWCASPDLIFRLSVDSIHLPLNLSDVRFFADSVMWIARHVDTRMLRRLATVEVHILASDLGEMVESSLNGLEVDSVSVDITPDQLFVLQRFQERLANAGPRRPGN